MSEAACFVLAPLLGALWTTPAAAFTDPLLYYTSPSEGGGGGRWFTGSPAEGYSCAVCHAPIGSEHVELLGLPEAGYEPGMSYELSLAWPEFAARASASGDSKSLPSTGLVAELVGENGEGAGTLSLVPVDDTDPAQLCAFPEGKQPVQLYRLPPGQATVEAGSQCVSDALGERCIAALLPCGAQGVRFTWTAPDSDQGTIWFAAGFVATEQVSEDASGDAVTEFLVPIGGPGTDPDAPGTVFQSGCAVEGPGAASSERGGLAVLCALPLLCVLRRRARGRV